MFWGNLERACEGRVSEEVTLELRSKDKLALIQAMAENGEECTRHKGQPGHGLWWEGAWGICTLETMQRDWRTECSGEKC